MAKQKFSFAYIDAFAGTGYRQKDESSSNFALDFPEVADDEAQGFLKGSARIALEVEPTFQTYIFIEKDLANAEELRYLHQAHFPKKKVSVVVEEANAQIQKLCAKNWKKHRAVMFLDPFGMQVTWQTIEAIARTQAIDLWILFPLGVGVNRMLTRSGEISPGWRKRLDLIFGTPDWYDEFYKTETTTDLWGETTRTVKNASFERIGAYFLNRLRTIFAGVAERPQILINSRNNPIFTLCFAAGNKRGAPTAVKIAQDILKG